MYRASVTVDNDVFEAINDAMRRYPTLMETVYKRNTRRLRTRVINTLATQPGPPQYPLRWKSERQRRAFFATNGFGGGIPYQRSGRLSAGWKADFRQSGSDGVVFEVYNDTPYTRYVQGIDAQPFHLDTGWVQADTVISNARVEAEDILIDSWYTVVDGTV